MVFYPLPCDEVFGSVAVNPTRYLPPELLQLLTSTFYLLPSTFFTLADDRDNILRRSARRGTQARGYPFQSACRQCIGEGCPPASLCFRIFAVGYQLRSATAVSNKSWVRRKRNS